MGSPFLKPHPEYTLFPEITDYKWTIHFLEVIGYIDEPTDDNDQFEFRQLIFNIDGKEATYDHVRAFGKRTDDKEYIYTHVSAQTILEEDEPVDLEGQTSVGYDTENTADDLDGQIISLLVDIYKSNKTVITFVTADSTAQTATTIDRSVSDVDRASIQLALTLYACKANESALLKDIGINP